MHRSLLRVDLLGRTVPLLHLYLQPSLMGYPPFNDFPALYNASSTLFRFEFRVSIEFLDEINSTNVLPVIGKLVNKNLPDYLLVVGRLLNEFGNVDPSQDRIFTQISLISGEFLCSTMPYANKKATFQR